MWGTSAARWVLWIPNSHQERAKDTETMTTKAIENGTWTRIVSGPLHRRGEERMGVVDAERQYPSGRCYRVIDPRTRVNWGWINEGDLRVTTAPARESIVSAEVRQQAMDLLTGGKVRVS